MTVASPSKTSPSSSSRSTNRDSDQNAGDSAFISQSSLYKEFLAEREEILKYKWLESERLGFDIGFEKALLEWIRKHRDKWRAERRKKRPQAKPLAEK